jgi:hypothetical protein
MSVANRRWGAPRIHGELLKLGLAVSQIDRREIYGPLPGTSVTDVADTLSEPRAPAGRGECLDQVIALTAAGLRRVLNEYVTYYSRTRTHLSLNKNAPVPRPLTPPTAGRVIAIPQVGGLHHRYERRAA